MSINNTSYKRILLKLSGEAISKKDDSGHVSDIFDASLIDRIASIIHQLASEGIKIGIVIGGGNIWRGAYGKGVTRARADQMGMLSTVINCLRLEDAIEKAGTPSCVMTPILMNGFTQIYDFRKAIEFQDNGGVTIFGGGLGIPYVTTDTTVVIRGLETKADILMMAKNIDGIYTKDPRNKETGLIDHSVPRYKVVSYDECLAKNLKATDVSASAVAKEQGIDMYVFALSEPENILRAVHGEQIGTLVSHNPDTPAEFY